MGAQLVTESRELDSGDAWATLRRAHYWPLLKRGMERFRQADGFSYSRAIGFQVVLASIPALIFFVALAEWSANDTLKTSVESVVGTLTPGPTSGLLQQAVDQGERNAQGNTLAMVAGGIAALTAGAIGMNQFMLGASRMYGEDRNRPWLRRYIRAVLLALSVGVLLAGAFVAIAFGSVIADAVEGESVWVWLRWPLAAVGAALAIAALYKLAPNRNQPGVSWLTVGGITATVLWVLFSGGLAGYLSLSSTFGERYGALAGLIGLMVWAQLTGLAVLAGAAFSAQLEWERAELAGNAGQEADR